MFLCHPDLVFLGLQTLMDEYIKKYIKGKKVFFGFYDRIPQFFTFTPFVVKTQYSQAWIWIIGICTVEWATHSHKRGNYKILFFFIVNEICAERKSKFIYHILKILVKSTIVFNILCNKAYFKSNIVFFAWNMQ